jgi:hypothetical protein
MRRSALAICGAILASATVVAIYWPAPIVEVAEGRFAQQIAEDKWTLSCPGPCDEHALNAVCANFEVVGEPWIDLNSWFTLTVACPRGSSDVAQKDL